MIDGEGLAAFVAIAEQRSFSRAADTLGIAQSVASKRLRRLEDQLGTQLVDRTVRTAIRLTREGDIFLPQAIEALARLDRVERMGRSLGRGSSGPLRIGFVFSAAMNGTLGRILTAVRAGLPDIELAPRLMETPEQLAALDSCRLDIGLMRPRPSYPEDCRAIDIHSEELMVCLSTGHALAAASALRPDQLAGQCFIVPQFHEQVGLIDSIRRLADAGGFPMPRIVRTDDFVTAACLASAGEGLVLAPASLAKLNLDGVRFLAVGGFAERLRIVLVHRTDAPREALARILGSL
ncbi:transcriptional regulator, LysR family [Rhizorhabdus wittichii RW1]|uniref:Transcriptional regulator, LysR family n=2 Tax=Rhizorhabdus wittichii TaxID=160791 RepID=A0A9J9HFA5_RHIWR|nr:LysR family transcriptional regulator [Rhizorhabdus wittichii]ABQ70574.1 transcriptional regulator, LysR family [Rhizorhabdus wittichii RW1]QTH23903.1 LysR family transcriptional regulator [Rhizorhabdus wittichii]